MHHFVTEMHESLLWPTTAILCVNSASHEKYTRLCSILFYYVINFVGFAGHIYPYSLCLYNYIAFKITVDISGSPIENQRGSRKDPG